VKSGKTELDKEKRVLDRPTILKLKIAYNNKDYINNVIFNQQRHSPLSVYYELLIMEFSPRAARKLDFKAFPYIPTLKQTVKAPTQQQLWLFSFDRIK